MDNESTRALPEGASKLADKISASKYLMNGEFGERFTDAERNEIIAALRIAPHPAPEASKLADEHNAYGYAKRLAESLWERHWKNVAPDWKPLPDLIGVLTQIDNMTALRAASRPDEQQAAEDELRADDSRDNLALIDFISDKIGLPHDQELSRDNFSAWLAAFRPMPGREAPKDEIYSDSRLVRQLLDTYNVAGDKVFWMAAERLRALSPDAARPEPVAWRWRNCGSPEWVYQASVPINKHPDRLEIEPLFTQSGEQQS